MHLRGPFEIMKRVDLRKSSANLIMVQARRQNKKAR